MLKEIFNLEKEENLILNPKIKKIKKENTTILILYGEIRQKNNFCINCKNKEIVKNGSYYSEILLNNINNNKVLINLKKQRYTCEKCKKNFIPKIDFIDKQKRISNQILRKISIDSTTTLSNKEIAKRNFVSPNTVERNTLKFKEYLTINKKHLPNVVCVDEFRGVKNYKNKMNFIIIDGEKHKVKDILINRQKNTLYKYFLTYPKKTKENVKFFVTDMYDPYIKLGQKQFPRAEIIIDRFHTKRLMTIALKNKRIQIMNKFPKYTYQYKVLKKFRNLLFKKYKDISIKYTKIKYYEQFSSEYDILKYIIQIDEQLYNMYWAYQEFINVFDKKDIEGFRKFIYKQYTNISEEMKNTIKIYKKYEKYIINSLKYPYSNGVVEGINTKIKLLKRIAYGYRNFTNFRIKILLSFNLIEDIEDIHRKEKLKKYKNTS